MYALLNNLEYLVYSVSFLLIIFSAHLLYSSQFSDSNKRMLLFRYKDNFKRIKTGFRNHLYDEKAEKLLKEAGHPLRLTSQQFLAIRMFLLMFCVVLVSINWYSSGNPIPLSNIGIIVSVYLLTSTKNYLPLYYLLKKLKNIYNSEKNRECFLLYSMLLNEFYIDDNRPYNVYSILQKFSAYFDKIKPAIYKSLAVWKRNPESALDIFASEIGTEEAKDLAQILKSVEETSADKARDIIKSRYEQFQTSRHEHHRRTLKNIDLIGYIVVFVPTIAILFNMIFVLGLAVQSLLQRLNYH